MSSYIYKRNKEGIHYLDLAKTWEKLMVAARIVAATQAKNPKDVLVSYSLDISSLFENFSIWKLSQKIVKTNDFTVKAWARFVFHNFL